MSKEIFFTIATCSKDNLSELLETCVSVRLFTLTLPDVKFEHILVLSGYENSDLCSLQKVVNNYENNVKVNIIYMEPRGISAAFNKALEEARGNYLIFLNAGDILTPDCDCIVAINEVMGCFDSKNEFSSQPVYYFDVITTGNTRLASRRVRYPSQLNLHHFLKMGNPINHQSTLYPLKLAQQYAYPNLYVGMDYFVNFSMKLNGLQFCKLSGILITYNITGVSAQSPFKGLLENVKTFISESTKHRLFGLIILCILLLPIRFLQAFIRKVTYPLR